MTNPLFFLLLSTALLVGPSAAEEPDSEPTVDPTIRCAVKTYPPPPHEARNVTWFVVDLDEPPEKRWGHVIKRFLEPIKGLATHLDVLVAEQIRDHLGFYFPIKFFFWLLGKALPPTLRQELEGMATAAASAGVDFNSLVGLNVFYELTAACTSIVARGSDGRLVHARNLDFGYGLGVDPTTHQFVVSEYLRNLTINVEFRRGGKTLYRATSYAGYLTILNGVKKGEFSMSWNQREGDDDGIKSIFSWVLGLKKGVPMGVVTRRLFEEEAESFEEARRYLESVQLLSPVYFIVGGTAGDEGIVITRSDDRSILPETLSINSSYLLQTNYDHWSPPPPWDDRRTPGDFCLDGVAGRADFGALYDVLSTKPVLNLQTTFTALMNVTSGRLESFVRKCAYPCRPATVSGWEWWEK